MRSFRHIPPLAPYREDRRQNPARFVGNPHRIPVRERVPELHHALAGFQDCAGDLNRLIHRDASLAIPGIRFDSWGETIVINDEICSDNLIVECLKPGYC